MTLYDGYASAGDPGGGRDTTKFYAYDAKQHADQINANTAAISTAALSPAEATVATAESTTSTAYTKLATTTDKVTVTVGASGKVLVWFSSNIYDSGSSSPFLVSVAFSGANTQAASDAISVSGNNYTAAPGAPGLRSGAMVKLFAGLSPGVTTFDMQYKCPSGGTGTFTNRNIGALPFP
jgi:hypothetical protein